MDSTARTHRTLHQAARRASFEAGTSLAHAVQRGARWTHLDALVREVVRCHEEEDRLFDEMLLADGPTTGDGWTYIGDQPS